MNNITRLNQSEVAMTESFLEKVKSGEVTHGFLCYRDTLGELKYQVFSPEHATYILGMIERAKFEMCK